MIQHHPKYSFLTLSVKEDLEVFCSVEISEQGGKQLKVIDPKKFHSNSEACSLVDNKTSTRNFLAWKLKKILFFVASFVLILSVQGLVNEQLVKEVPGLAFLKKKMVIKCYPKQHGHRSYP